MTVLARHVLCAFFSVLSGHVIPIVQIQKNIVSQFIILGSQLTMYVDCWTNGMMRSFFGPKPNRRHLSRSNRAKRKLNTKRERERKKRVKRKKREKEKRRNNKLVDWNNIDKEFLQRSDYDNERNGTHTHEFGETALYS